MRYTKYVFLFLGLLFFNGSIPAQEKISLSIDQAIEIGLKNSKTLHSSLMKVKSAQSKAKESNALRLPSLKLNAGYRRLSEVDPFIINTPFGSFPIAPGIFDNYSAQLSLFQPLFTGFRLAGNLTMNEELANAVNEDYNRDKSELIFNIRNSYWSVFKAIQFKKLMDETVDQIKAHLDDARNLEKAGMITRNDILKIEVQLSNALYQQVDAENAVKLSTVALNNVIGIPLDTHIEISSEANKAGYSAGQLITLINEAIERRPELKAADSRIKAGEAGVTLAKSSWYPQISLYGNYYYSKPNQRILPTQNRFDATWDAGVNISMNVWDWFTTKHQTDQAEAQLAQAVDGFGLIKDGITMEVTQNYLNVNQAERKISIAKLSVEQAEENLRVTSQKFKNGLTTSSELIDAETALIGSRTNYTTSLVDYELAKAKLEKSIGK